jgi:hypothetical protein
VLRIALCAGTRLPVLEHMESLVHVQHKVIEVHIYPARPLFFFLPSTIAEDQTLTSKDLSRTIIIPDSQI